MTTLSTEPNKLAYLFVALLVTFFAIALLVDPAADPPLGVSDLEGQVLIGAKSLVPGHNVPLDDWNPALISPTQVALTTWAYRVFGVSLEVARSLTAGVSLLVVVLFFLLVRRMNPTVAVLATALLVLNPIFFGISRAALPAIYTLLWIEVAIWLWILGEKSTLFSVLSGFFVVWAGLWENAPTNAFFLGSGFFLLTALRLHGWKMVWLDATRHRINSFWFGVFAALLVFVFQLSQHWAEFGATWSHLQRGSLRLLAANTVMAPVYLSNMVKFMPLTIGLALFMFLFFAKNAIRPVARHRKLDEVRLWFLAWFVVGAGYFTILQVPPLESLVLLVPPLCVIAAEGLCALVSLRKIENPRVDVMIVSLLISGVVWFATAWWVNRFYHTMNLPAYFETHQIRGSLILVLLMWFVITSLLIWIYLKWQNFSFRPARGLMLVMAWAIGISVVGMSVRFHQDWWNHRQYTVREGSQELANLPSGSLVVGSWAPLLTLDKNIGATVVWNGLNESPRDWHGSVTHLLLAEGNESRAHLPPSSTFIQQGRKLKLLENAGISVGGKPLNLYELSP